MARVIFELLETKIEYFEDEIEHHSMLVFSPPYVQMAIHYDNRLRVAEYIITGMIPRFKDIVSVMLECDHIYGKKSDVVRILNERWDENLADYIKQTKVFSVEGVL